MDHLSRLRAVALGLVLLAVPWWCHAASVISPTGSAGLIYGDGVATFVDAGAGQVPVTFVGRTATAAPAGARAISLAESLTASIGGNTLPVVATRAATAIELGNAVAAVGAAAWGGCAIGTAIASAAGMGNQSNNGARITCNVSDWLMDQGTPPVMTPGWCTSGSYCASTAQASCSQYVAANWNATIRNGVPTNVNGTMWCKVYNNSDGSFYVQAIMNQSGSYPTCSPVIDALNPAYSIPNPIVGPDGKCPTGRYSVATPTQVSNQIGQYGDVTKLPALAQDVLNKGGTIPVADDRHMTGPSSVPGTPTTTTSTNPDGSTTTTTKTPTVSYTYNNNTVNYYTTTVTTTQSCAAGGSCTTGTTTSTDKPQESDQCKAHPETLGCLKLGDLPTDQPQWQTKTVTFAPESVGGSAACPAPGSVTLPYLGRTLTWSYQPACDIAPTISAGMQLLCALGCLLFIIQAVRS